MKKDIEWFNNEVEKRINRIKTGGVSFFGGDLYGEGYIYGMREVQAIANQLDEPEVLSQEWIDENSTNLLMSSPMIKWVEASKLQNLLVPKKELPTIPQFVADWIEEAKKQRKSLVFAITYIYDKNEIGKSPNKEENRIFQWMELADNEEVFARAWLDGYEVEKEPKYVIDTDEVEISDGNHYLTHLSLSKDDAELPIVGCKDDAIRFDSEEQAQAIADYVGGRVEELEE